jgi:hypothetical protein
MTDLVAPPSSKHNAGSRVLARSRLPCHNRHALRGYDRGYATAIKDCMARAGRARIAYLNTYGSTTAAAGATTAPPAAVA